MAGMTPLLRVVANTRPHQIGLIFLDPYLVNAGDGAPEAPEVFHFTRVALHPDHLNHNLHPRSAILFHTRETDEVVAHLFEACALAVKLEALLGCAIET